MHGLVFAHGAGAGMSHSFMVRMADALLDEDIATLRYQFPYMEYGKRIPDRQPKLLDTVRAAVECFGEIAPDMKCVAGGKSMGGRMTSLAVSKGLVPRVTAIAFFGFPLHPPKKPGTEQAKHLAEVDVPMMFVQGTRDKLAPKDLLQPIIDDLDKAVVDW
ncbi:MAG: alpha/beta family hydrolase, partial [Pseudomonadota bacterium]